MISPPLLYRPTMPRWFRPIGLALAAAMGLAGACFVELGEPPTVRFACGSAADCLEGEACIEGLCQPPCTLATFSDACPPDAAACINGVCASVCDPTVSNACTAPQECLTIDTGSGSGDFGGTSIGLCGTLCTEDSCPEGEGCFEGFCLTTCDAADPDSCGEGETCLAGICVPEDSAP